MLKNFQDDEAETNDACDRARLLGSLSTGSAVDGSLSWSDYGSFHYQAGTRFTQTLINGIFSMITLLTQKHKFLIGFTIFRANLQYCKENHPLNAKVFSCILAN